MDSKVQEVVKETIINLHKKGIDATPNEYKKEFCKISKSYNLSIKECEIFKDFVTKLSKNEQIEIKDKNITTLEDMIPILLTRISKKNLDSLSKLFQESILPSISIDIDEDLHKFSVKIGNSPALILENDIQKEMQNYITKRFEADKKIVKEKTAEIAKMLTLMGQYFNDAIQSNNDGSKKVSHIKSEIQSINMEATDINILTNLQTKLISAAKSIENEMTNVEEKFSSGKSNVETLEKKVIQLQKELEKTREESIRDHLTGLLTRRAYDDQIKRIENNFIRNNTQYAIVFFDIDHFKKVNDTYGHEAGDVVLSTFAKILGKNTRDLDIVSRYGGEEFVAVVHFNLRRELLKYLKRIKSIIQENSFLYKNIKIQVTFSAGVAIRNNHSSYESTIQKSDMLLYQAKESGRNKIILEDGTVI